MKVSCIGSAAVVAALASGAMCQQNSELITYVEAFYDDLVVNRASYVSEYSSFFKTHTFQIPSSYASIVQSMAMGIDYHPAVESDPALASALYTLMPEFPWYSTFEATATVEDPLLVATSTAAPAVSVSVSAAASTATLTPESVGTAVTSATTGSSASATLIVSATASSTTMTNSTVASVVSGDGSRAIALHIVPVLVMAAWAAIMI